MKKDGILLYQEARASVYKALSLYYYEPEQKVVNGKSLTFLVSQLKVACPNAEKYVFDMKRDVEFSYNKIQHLLIDYARLFVGPFDLLAPPYGSVYLEKTRRIMGETTENALRDYREAGLEMDRAFYEPPDHIAVELEFMYYLVFLNINAAGDKMQIQNSFLNHHIGLWVEDFAGLVEKWAATEFYRNLARITRLFVKTDQSLLNKQVIDKQNVE